MKTLKELRISYGLSQREIAEIFGVSTRTIQNVEKDSSNIRDSLLSKYLKAFDVKYDEIFLGPNYEIFEVEQKKKHEILYSINQRLGQPLV